MDLSADAFHSSQLPQTQRDLHGVILRVRMPHRVPPGLKAVRERVNHPTDNTGMAQREENWLRKALRTAQSESSWSRGHRATPSLKLLRVWPNTKS